jgi:6-carboxyhexanoate--CoA ligase
MTESLNSLRMRAERDGKHISGAERLVCFDELQDTAFEMLQRALLHPRGQAENINICVEPISRSDLQIGRLLDLHNNQVQSWQQGRELAAEMLDTYGVTKVAVERAINHLASGAAPDGQSMRGAMLIDADSGERLEADQTRGIRVSRMDLSSEARQQLRSVLAAEGLDNPHVIEALTLAAKVVSAPSVVAELCWSDDPDYLAGYVASENGGYQRISLLKPAGEERGGRAFFVRCSKDRLGALVKWLERHPFLIDRLGRVHSPRLWSADG